MKNSRKIKIFLIFYFFPKNAKIPIKHRIYIFWESRQGHLDKNIGLVTTILQNYMII